MTVYFSSQGYYVSDQSSSSNSTKMFYHSPSLCTRQVHQVNPRRTTRKLGKKFTLTCICRWTRLFLSSQFQTRYFQTLCRTHPDGFTFEFLFNLTYHRPPLHMIKVPSLVDFTTPGIKWGDWNKFVLSCIFGACTTWCLVIPLSHRVQHMTPPAILQDIWRLLSFS